MNNAHYPLRTRIPRHPSRPINPLCELPRALSVVTSVCRVEKRRANRQTRYVAPTPTPSRPLILHLRFPYYIRTHVLLSSAYRHTHHSPRSPTLAPAAPSLNRHCLLLSSAACVAFVDSALFPLRLHCPSLLLVCALIVCGSSVSPFLFPLPLRCLNP